MTDGVQITGGAGRQETAAILAAVVRVLQDEAAQASRPQTAPKQSSWVLAWRPREAHAPLPSHTYDVTPWSDAEQDKDGD